MTMDKLSRLEKKMGITGATTGTAGPPKLGYPAHPEGSNVMQVRDSESALEEPKLTPEEQEYPAADDHNKDSTNLPTNEGKRPRAWAATEGAELDDLDKPFEAKAGVGNLGGAVLGGLAGTALAGPLGGIAGATLGHRMQHAPTNVMGGAGGGSKGEGSAATARPGSEHRGPGVPEKIGGAARRTTGAIGRAIDAYRNGTKHGPMRAGTTAPIHGGEAGKTTEDAASKLRSTTGGIRGVKLGDGPMEHYRNVREGIGATAGRGPIVTSPVEGGGYARGPAKAGRTLPTPGKEKGSGAAAAALRDVTGGISGVKLGDGEEPGFPVFVLPKDGKLHLYAAEPSVPETKTKGIGTYQPVYKGPMENMALGYIMDDDTLMVPHEGAHHHYSVIMDDAADANTAAPVEKGLAGAAAGAYMGYIVGGPLGAIAGAYLGHKVQGSVNPAGQDAKVGKDGPAAADVPQIPHAAEADERRKTQANDNMGGGLEQKPDPHADLEKWVGKCGSREIAHRYLIVKSGKRFDQVYDQKCFECRKDITYLARPTLYYKSLAKAIDTGIVAVGALSPSDITRFHKDRQSLNRVLPGNAEREV